MRNISKPALKGFFIPFMLSILMIVQVAGAESDPNTKGAGDRQSGGGIGEKSPRTPAKSAGKNKQTNLADPSKMAEILEQAVIVNEAAASGKDQDRLDLPVKGPVSSKVGPRVDPINGVLRFHKGIDVAIPAGTPITPVAAGKVVYSGNQSGYGNMVILQHGDGMLTIYAHHSRNLVKTGDKVDSSMKIALAGSTGHSTGPHLHFEAWKGGVNVTEAFLPNFAGRKFAGSSHISLDETNLRKVILADGTILFVEIAKPKQ